MAELKSEMTSQEKRDYVLKQLKEQIDNIKIISKAENNINNYQRQDDGLYREPLSIDLTKEVKILLSWGGGEDGFKLTFSKNNELLKGVYYCADWGQYEEITLNEEELNLVSDFYLMGEIPSWD